LSLFLDVVSPHGKPIVSMFDERDSDSEGSELEEALSGVIFADQPRTVSEIKRSRILLDRRYVFLCPTSLSKHFNVVPKQAKDAALLVFKCSRDWLFKDSKESRKRAQSRVECGITSLQVKKAAVASRPKSSSSRAAAYHSEFSKEFMQWVLAKENDGCIYWWKPEKDFMKLSKFFEEHIDPLSEQPYRPLLLDPHWWRVIFSRANARFCNNPAVVCANISERSNAGIDKRDVAIHVLQELIHQSNPTLEPVAKWPYAPSMRFLPRAPPSTRDFVGQYASFKGYIDRGTATRTTESRTREEETRISQWPVVPRERLDDLHHSWQMDDALSRTLPNLSGSSPPKTAPSGGLFGLGFGQGMRHRYQRTAYDRSPPASAPASCMSAREVGL